MGDDKKDILVGATNVAAAALIASPAAAALVPVIAAVALEKISSASKRRAERIVARMIEMDEPPGDFADYLNARLMDEDEEVIGALRTLLLASIDAIAPAALEPMALVGRRYLRKQTPAWIARGWTRLLAELTEAELRALREIVVVGVKTWRRLQSMGSRPAVELIVSRGGGDRDHVGISASLPEFRGARPIAAGHASRLVDLMAMHQLGRDRIVMEPDGFPSRGKSAPMKPVERFTFHANAFKSIAEAFPADTMG